MKNNKIDLVETPDVLAREIYFPYKEIHRHNCFEISYGVKGSCYNQINGQKFFFDSSVCSIVRPGDYHCFIDSPSVPNPEKYKHIDIYADYNVFKQICDNVDETLFDTITNSKEPIVFNIPMSLIQSISHKVNAIILNTHSKNILNHFFYFILTAIIGEYYEHIYFTTPNYPNWLNDLLQKLHSIDYLSLNISQLAEKINYSSSHISREFKKYVGVNLVDYIIDERIKYSITLIQSKDLKIIDIADIVGYQKQSTFSTHFKKVMKMSPKEYQMLTK